MFGSSIAEAKTTPSTLPSVANSGPPELPGADDAVQRVDVADDGLRVAEVRPADLASVAHAGRADVERPATRDSP